VVCAGILKPSHPDGFGASPLHHSHQENSSPSRLGEGGFFLGKKIKRSRDEGIKGSKESWKRKRQKSGTRPGRVKKNDAICPMQTDCFTPAISSGTRPDATYSSSLFNFSGIIAPKRWILFRFILLTVFRNLLY